MYDPTNINTLEEVYNYIEDCIGQTNRSDLQKAYDIVCLVVNNHFDKWYANYPEFAEVFDLASDLEVKSNAEMWNKLKVSLNSLRKRTQTAAQ